MMAAAASSSDSSEQESEFEFSNEYSSGDDSVDELLLTNKIAQNNDNLTDGSELDDLYVDSASSDTSSDESAVPSDNELREITSDPDPPAKLKGWDTF